MPEALSISVVVSPELTRTLDALANPGPIFARFLRVYGRRVQGIVRDKYLTGGSGRLNVRTGALRRSVLVDESNIPRSVAVGSALIYAPPHEYGATITARRSGLLIFRDRSGRVTGSARTVRIPARPFITPAVADAQREGPELLRAEVSRVPGVS